MTHISFSLLVEGERKSSGLNQYESFSRREHGKFPDQQNFLGFLDFCFSIQFEQVKEDKINKNLI